MSLPDVVSLDNWLATRKALLEKEKALTRARDELNMERRMLPMVRVEKDYAFEGPTGTAGLRDLFDGHQQLILYHFMFAPDWEKGCTSCTGWADQLSEGLLRHLASRETSFAMVSRAPVDKLQAYKAERQWSMPWYSSGDGDFNYDFGVTVDEGRGAQIYNYRTIEEHKAAGTDYYFSGEPPHELPGISCFLQTKDGIFHTYSTYGRGGETIGGAYYFLDLTALGRQEDWEKPAGRSEAARGARPNFED